MGEAQRKLADDSVNAFLFQLPQAAISDANLNGVWKDSPIFANDLSAMSWK
jgi:peptide/nickel transport system substrate-binding protein